MLRRFPLPGDRRSKRTTKMIRKFILVFAISGIALTASACNTVKGLGRDIESVGQAGDDAM